MRLGRSAFGVDGMDGKKMRAKDVQTVFELDSDQRLKKRRLAIRLL